MLNIFWKKRKFSCISQPAVVIVGPWASAPAFSPDPQFSIPSLGPQTVFSISGPQFFISRPQLPIYSIFTRVDFYFLI